MNSQSCTRQVSSASSSSSSSSLTTDNSNKVITVVDIQKNATNQDDINSEFITVLSVGDQVNIDNDNQDESLCEEITIYRAQGERIGMALKFEGGTGPGDVIDKVFIQTVNTESPAARASSSLLSSLRPGDQIVRIQGKNVNKMKRTDCVALLRDAPVCISLYIKRSLNITSDTTNEASCQMNNVNNFGSKKGPPPPVPPRLSTTTLSALTKNQCNSKVNTSVTTTSTSVSSSSSSSSLITSPCVSPNQLNNNSAGKSIISPGNNRKKPPPLPPRRPRDPPPAAPVVKSVSTNGQVNVKSSPSSITPNSSTLSSTPSSSSASPSSSSSSSSSSSTGASATSSNKRTPSSNVNRTSDVQCNIQSKNKRSESSGKKQHQQSSQPVISEANNLTPEPAQVYMDILDKEGTLESESDDTCSSVSTIIDKLHRVSNDKVSNNNTGIRKTPTIDLDAILAPFQQLERELDSREADHSALQKFVDETKAVMNDIQLTSVNYSSVNLDDYDDIASVSNNYEDIHSSNIVKDTTVDILNDSLNSHHVNQTTERDDAPSSSSSSTAPMKRANVSPSSSRLISKAKVKEVKLLTNNKTRGILKYSSTETGKDFKCIGKSNRIQSVNSVSSTVHVTSLIPKLGLYKSSSSPVVVPRKSHSMGNLLFDGENGTSRPSLIPRPVQTANRSLTSSSRIRCQSTRDIHMSRSHLVSTKSTEQQQHQVGKGEMKRKYVHETCTREYNGNSDTEQSDHKKSHKDDEQVTSLAPAPVVTSTASTAAAAAAAQVKKASHSSPVQQVYTEPVEEKKLLHHEQQATEIIKCASIIDKTIHQNNKQSSEEKEEEKDEKESTACESSSVVARSPVEKESRQPIFKEDQHLIKSYSAHDTKNIHHEVDPVSVGDDKDKQQQERHQQETICSSSSSHTAICEDATKNGPGESSECTSSSSSSSSGGEDNTSPILLRSVKTSKVLRHDDSGVFSEETDSPSPDCMSVKRSPFGPFHRSPQLSTSNGTTVQTVNDEITSTSSSSDPGVASIASSDCLTDGDNNSETGSEVKHITLTGNVNKNVDTETLETSQVDCRQNIHPSPSVKERIALFQAVVEASTYKSLSSKSSKSLYDIRNEWNKSHPSNNHRTSSTEINRNELYSSSSSSESDDVVTSVGVPSKVSSSRRYTSHDSLSSITVGRDKDNHVITPTPLVSDSLDSHRHTKVSTSISPQIVKEQTEQITVSSVIDDNSSGTCSVLSRESSSSITSNVSSRPFYSMSDLVSPSLASSSILSSLRINPPKYSPALKRRNPEMLTRSSDFSQYSGTCTSYSSSAINHLQSADRSDTVPPGASESGAFSPSPSSSSSSFTGNSCNETLDSSIKCDETETTTHVKSANDASESHCAYQDVKEETNKPSESDDDTSESYIDSAKHFKQLAQKWEERILRDRQIQSKMILRPSLVASKSNSSSLSGLTAASLYHRKVLDDSKLQQQQHLSDNLSLLPSQGTTPPSQFTLNVSTAVTSKETTVADCKVQNTTNGTINNCMVSPVTCTRWPIDNNNSPVTRNSSLFEEDESVTLRESNNKSNSDRCVSSKVTSKVEKEKKSDAFSTVKVLESTDNAIMYSIDSSTSDSGTSSPGFSGSSIGVSTTVAGTSSIQSISSAHSPSVTPICKETSNHNTISRFNSMSNLRKNDQQYGSVTSLASSTSVISPQELQLLIDEAKNSIDGGELNYGQHCIQVVVLNRDYSANGPVGISLAGGADCETKEITVHRIITGSIADRDGKVKKGDIILSINGKIMRGVSHREAVEVLRSPASEVVLVLARSNTIDSTSCSSSSTYSKYSSSGLDSPSRLSLGTLECTLSSSLASLSEESPLASLSKAYKIVRASLNKDGAGLGFILEGGKDSPLGDRPLAIKKIFKGGLADKEGTLIAGDELISVNDQSVEHMTRTEAWNFLKKLPNAPVHMLVRRVDYGF